MGFSLKIDQVAKEASPRPDFTDVLADLVLHWSEMFKLLLHAGYGFTVKKVVVFLQRKSCKYFQLCDRDHVVVRKLNIFAK